MEAFCNWEVAVLIVTNFAGRGLEKAEAPVVMQADLPATIEAYTHRVARSGRGGGLGISLSYVGAKDKPLTPALVAALHDRGEEAPQFLLGLSGASGLIE